MWRSVPCRITFSPLSWPAEVKVCSVACSMFLKLSSGPAYSGQQQQVSSSLAADLVVSWVTKRIRSGVVFSLDKVSEPQSQS